MENEVDIIRGSIKAEIHRKYDLEIRYAKDCQLLSDIISEKINRQLSVTTLKRFFGIIQSPFQPSKYTMDTLALFLEHKNWRELILSIKNNSQNSCSINSWEELRNWVMKLTNCSLDSYQTKLIDHKSHFPSRAFAEKKIDSFLQSDQIATAFIAPDGYGKSAICYQITRKFFVGENAKHPNDIVCLLDGSILPEIISQNPSNTYLNNLMNYEPSNSFSHYFRNNPEKVNGRFVLIIDGLNEIFYQNEKLSNFIKNLLDIQASYENISWFKLIISCKPDVWAIFCNLLNKKQHLKSNWFDVSFEGSQADMINVPLLENYEIKKYLRKNHPELSYENLVFHYPEITEIINTPYFLHLFCWIKNIESIHTDIELLNQVAYQKILTPPYAYSKSQVIDKIFELSDYGRNFSLVNKEALELTEEHRLAYQDLLDDNILCEYTVAGQYLSIHTSIQFSHEILMEFFLSNKWLKENELNLNLIREIIIFYSNNRNLQSNLIKYIIKFAFKEGKTDIIKDIYSIFEQNHEKQPRGQDFVDAEITKVIGIELRRNKDLRRYLIPFFASSSFGKLCFFENYFDMDSLVIYSGENVKYYLENNNSQQAKIYGHYLKFMQYFLADDQIKCKDEFELIRSFKIPQNLNPLYTGLFYSPQIIYESVFMSEPDELLMKKIKQKAEFYYHEGIQLKTSIPNYDFLIVFALNIGNQSALILEFAELIFNRYMMIDFHSSWTYQLFISIYARTLLNSGEEKKALELFKQVEFKTIPSNLNYYIKLRYYLIKIEFLIFEKKLTKAKQVVEEVKIISKMIRFKFFYDKAMHFDKIICPDLQRSKEAKHHDHIN